MGDIYWSFFRNEPLASIAVFVTVLPILLIFYRKAYSDPSFSILLAYTISKLLIDLIMYHEAAQRHNTLIYFNISSPIRYGLLSWMFYYKIEIDRYKPWIIISIAAFTFFSIWEMFDVNPDILNFHEHRVSRYSPTLECLLIIFWILVYFYDTIRQLKIPNLLTYPFFWVSSGLLINYSSFVFIAPLLHYTQNWNRPLDLGFLEQIPYIFEIICTLFISVGISFFSAKYYYARK